MSWCVSTDYPHTKDIPMPGEAQYWKPGIFGITGNEKSPRKASLCWWNAVCGEKKIEIRETEGNLFNTQLDLF
jgi:hypothetical protein